MKRCVLCLVALVLMAAPAVAPAAEPAACTISTGGGDPGEEYGRLGTQAQPIAHELAGQLGEQFGGFWLQPRDGSWYLGLAPGAVTAEELRRRALELVDARHDGEDEQRLRDRLRVFEQPYGEPELRRIQDELTRKAGERGWNVAWVVVVGCQHSDTWRVEWELYSDASADVVEEARALAEPYGDRVRIVHLRDMEPPRLTAESRGAPRIADLVRVRGCRVSLRRSARARVRSLKVRRAGPRTASVRIRLKDGRNIRDTVRLRSCARS